ncbi:MAG TPA: lysophospholipid acyltransferase family protein [Spongiibacteraceae bacterium]|nr:lysophospholipid acyltransferase family protein [Spongiibacteraceae bacterium]
MANSLFRTPILQPLLAWVAVGILRLIGWRVIGELPAQRKYVLIGAPHTSNWDFPLMLLAMLKVGMDVHWLGKSALFPFPFAGFMRWLGGIPVDRSKNNNLVDQLVDLYRRRDELVLIIPPEGTRSKVERWKTGFYYVALGAGVPILLGFVDGSRKEMGFGPLFYPTGDYAADLPAIQAFYSDKAGVRRERH